MSRRVVDSRSFYSAMTSVVVVMVASGIVVPHIDLEVLRELGLFWVSSLTLGFMLARSYSSLLHARLYGSLTPKLTGVLALGLLIVCYVLYTVLPPITYPLISVLDGFSSGLFWPLMQSLLVHGVDRRWRSRALSIYFLVGNLARYAGYQIGSVIYVYLGPGRIVYSGILVLISHLALYSVMSPGHVVVQVKKTGYGFREIVGEIRYVRSLVPLFFIVGGVNGLLKDYLFAYVKLITGYDEPTLRTFWSIVGYVGLGLSVLTSHLHEALGKTRLVLMTSTVFTLSVTSLAFVRNPILVCTALSLTIIGVRTLRPMLRGVASNLTRRPEAGIALANSLSNMAAGLMPFVVGLVGLVV